MGIPKAFPFVLGHSIPLTKVPLVGGCAVGDQMSRLATAIE